MNQKITSPEKPRSVKETLQCAMNLIRLKEHFAQNAWAKTRSGLSVNARSAEAVRFCAIGAVIRINGAYELSARLTLTALAMKLYPNHEGMTGVNDKLGHAAVLRVYREAIKRA